MKTLVNFDIFAISEHWLYSEQLHKVDNFSSLYRSHCVSSNDNSDILSGKRAFAGVGLLWKASFGDLISLLSIDSDRIVGIQYACPNRVTTKRRPKTKDLRSKIPRVQYADWLL